MKLEDKIENPEQLFGPETIIIEKKKNEYILAANKVEKYIYYVISGSIASFIEKDGEEHCIGFHTKGNFFSDYTSFLDQTKGEGYSRVLQNCRLAAVHYNTLQEAYKLSAAHERKGRLISEQLYKNISKRSNNLLLLNAEERYLNFLKERPEDVLEVPLKYIASYLGMTPVSLSRIRARIRR